MKFRKKPVEIEAIQWTGDNIDEISKFMNYKLHDYDKFNGLHIYTLEGRYKASINDWIIKGIVGEFYPCKPDIFENTYEKVD